MKDKFEKKNESYLYNINKYILEKYRIDNVSTNNNIFLTQHTSF